MKSSIVDLCRTVEHLGTAEGTLPFAPIGNKMMESGILSTMSAFARSRTV